MALQPDNILSLQFHFVPVEEARCAARKCFKLATYEITNASGFILFYACDSHVNVFGDIHVHRLFPYECEESGCDTDAEFQTEIIGGPNGVSNRLCKVHKDEMIEACKSFRLK